jgi:hypothetical protein
MHYDTVIDRWKSIVATEILFQQRDLGKIDASVVAQYDTRTFSDMVERQEKIHAYNYYLRFFDETVEDLTAKDTSLEVQAKRKAFILMAEAIRRDMMVHFNNDRLSSAYKNALKRMSQDSELVYGMLTNPESTH